MTDKTIAPNTIINTTEATQHKGPFVDIKPVKQHNKNKRPITMAQRVRSLLVADIPTGLIAAQLGVSRQYIYNVRYDMKKSDERKANKSNNAKRISKLTGKPVRKYVRKEQQAAAPKEIIKEVVKYVPIEVEVPVPVSFENFTFWQRMRMLFGKKA